MLELSDEHLLPLFPLSAFRRLEHGANHTHGGAGVVVEEAAARRQPVRGPVGM